MSTLSHTQVVIANGVYVVWARFPISESEAWRYARYLDQREFIGSDAIRVFPADSFESAQSLANLLA
jgi:hypothetical protein